MSMITRPGLAYLMWIFFHFSMTMSFSQYQYSLYTVSSFAAPVTYQTFPDIDLGLNAKGAIHYQLHETSSYAFQLGMG